MISAQVATAALPGPMAGVTLEGGSCSSGVGKVKQHNIRGFGLIAGACGVILAGCASGPEGQRPHAGVQPGAAREAEARQALDRDLVAQASAFESFMRH